MVFVCRLTGGKARGTVPEPNNAKAIDTCQVPVIWVFACLHFEYRHPTWTLTLPFPHSPPSDRNIVNFPWPFMSSTGQATSQIASPVSNIQLITNALTEYAKITGIDLTDNHFATALEQSNSPEAILRLIQEREKAFKEYRDGNRRLIRCLSPAVNVIHAFAGILGEAVSHANDLVVFLTDFVRSPSHQRRLFLLESMFSSLYVPRIRLLSVSFVMDEYDRLPVGFHPATMPFSSCSSVWGTSLSVWRSIRRFRPLP